MEKVFQICGNLPIKIKEIDMKKVLMYSGGWDSFCAAKIHPDAKKIYVNLHTPYSEVEIKHLPPDVEVLDLNLQKFVLLNGFHIPQRNAILALLGVASVMKEAEIDKDYKITVYLCGVKEDKTAPDKNPEYFRKLSDLASSFTSQKIQGKTINWKINVEGFFEDDKISLWKKAGKPDMRNVISCHTGDNCGKCLDCKRRLLYLNYLYPDEFKIDKQAFINELKENGWLINEQIYKEQ